MNTNPARDRSFGELEVLESRKMMDATSFYMVYGSPANDVISVQQVQPVFAAGLTISTRSLPSRIPGGLIGDKPSSTFKFTVNGYSWTATVPTTQRIRIAAGYGNDVIRVGGSRGMDLMGEAGNDTLVGGDGDDLLAGGLDSDTVDYSARMTTVVLTCDNRADDGRGSERDNILSDVEVLIGGQADDYIGAWAINYLGRTIYGNLGNDKLFGSSAHDTIIGGGGNDYILGNAGIDYLAGGTGNDTIRGGEDRDVVAGDAGNDVLYADSGADALLGGDGNDRLYSGRDADELFGGRGRDILVSLGGSQLDVLWGGSDPDTFWMDSESTEKLGDLQSGESKRVHRIARFNNLKVDGVDMGAPSRELTGQRLPDPKALFNYRNFSGKPLFSDAGPRATDIDQGDWVNDCYFLAALSAVAKVNPNALGQNVVDLGDGTFAVHFYDGPSAQISHFLRVDADLSTYGDGTPAYAGLGAQNSLWVAVLEKAWAFYRGNLGNYSATDFGDAGEAFKTLGITWNNHYTANASAMFTTLEQLLSQNKAVTLSTKSAATGLVQRHAYMVDRVSRDTAGNMFVTLRNPWGTDGPGADATNDGYVTLSAENLFNQITKIESATA